MPRRRGSQSREMDDVRIGTEVSDGVRRGAFEKQFPRSEAEVVPPVKYGAECQGSRRALKRCGGLSRKAAATAAMSIKHALMCNYSPFNAYVLHGFKPRSE